METDASGVVLGARLLLVREGMNFWCSEMPDNVILYLITFASKSQSSTE